MSKPIVTSRAWWGLLVVYVALFGITCYIAFFSSGYNPAHANPVFLEKLAQGSPEVRAFVLETLKGDAEIFSKTRDLARNAFNIILGGLVGFLSASGTQLLGVRSE
jgi:hypothetical protein